MRRVIVKGGRGQTMSVVHKTVGETGDVLTELFKEKELMINLTTYNH